MHTHLEHYHCGAYHGEGLRAYLLGQADLQKGLASHFQEIWCGALDSDNNNDGDADDSSEYEGVLECS